MLVGPGVVFEAQRDVCEVAFQPHYEVFLEVHNLFFILWCLCDDADPEVWLR